LQISFVVILPNIFKIGEQHPSYRKNKKGARFLNKVYRVHLDRFLTEGHKRRPNRG